MQVRTHACDAAEHFNTILPLRLPAHVALPFLLTAGALCIAEGAFTDWHRDVRGSGRQSEHFASSRHDASQPPCAVLPPSMTSCAPVR